MKDFVEHHLSLSACEKEFQEFEQLLDNNSILHEQKHILPFFREKKNLSILISLLNSAMMNRDRLAYEYPLWGDFRCDLAVADSERRSFCFVEFEHYDENNIFTTIGNKATKEYAPAFEHGFSQIVDWFWRIDGFKNTAEMKHKFGNEAITYSGILIIGRRADLDDNNYQRLKWRQDNITIANQKIQYLTFDDLRTHFRDTINYLKQIT